MANLDAAFLNALVIALDGEPLPNGQAAWQYAMVRTPSDEAVWRTRARRALNTLERCSAQEGNDVVGAIRPTSSGTSTGGSGGGTRSAADATRYATAMTWRSLLDPLERCAWHL
ncbi:hypothetical protein, partial [Klebsiella pneumoniae]|uniref:hypothetical protein n=1 Tax=Klebsiella pneumoniae TaxID=573 RepID=UPI0025A14C81